ncbi:hypothetical protein [Thioalkalivibrio sulfidiphilus]|uniref:Flagellar basal-body/hook protein C-terminal domain-containing protein n=1 Tax=Thioalkalivibrio sulfidiphilus (strain HL-EbGR7) TaxID=396588 RepID=B8GN99_THISH|nr:hypothetical protein [Thioalkalivibrio sulfidiphilus]ACL71960.1 conserved hypothetical protein [Thioalkalivibrio sulfidiphilus HL-EbGr7]
MAITPAAGFALNGIQRGMEGLQRNAADIASADRLNGEATTSVVEPLVGQIQNSTQIEASVKVLQAENRMLGALLDVKA